MQAYIFKSSLNKNLLPVTGTRNGLLQEFWRIVDQSLAISGYNAVRAKALHQEQGIHLSPESIKMPQKLIFQVLLLTSYRRNIAKGKSAEAALKSVLSWTRKTGVFRSLSDADCDKIAQILSKLKRQIEFTSIFAEAEVTQDVKALRDFDYLERFVLWTNFRVEHRPARLAKCPATVLIADDERAIADTLRELLVENGHYAKSVYSGDETIQTARWLLPSIVLLGSIMPGTDTVETGKALLGFLPNAKIALITEPVPKETMIRLWLDDCNFECFPLPNSGQALLDQVNTWSKEQNSSVGRRTGGAFKNWLVPSKWRKSHNS